MTLFLVRHGRPLIEQGRPAVEWELDPAGFDDVWAIRESGRLPEQAAWFCAPSPVAQQTAQLLTDGQVGVVEGLRQQVRGSTWVDAFDEVLTHAFAEPGQAAADGWEPLADTRHRTAATLEGIRAAHPEEHVVLIGHATVWTLLVAHLAGESADVEHWRSWALPDVRVLERG